TSLLSLGLSFTTAALLDLKMKPLLTLAFALLTAVPTVFLLLKLRRAIREEGWKRGLISRPFTTMGVYILAVQFVLAVLGGLSNLLLPPKLQTIVGVGVGFTLIIPFVLIIILFYPISTCAALFRSYRESGAEEKRQVRWPLWGTMAALAVNGLLTISNLIILGVFGQKAVISLTMPTDIIVKAAYLLIPVSVAFGILKYKLMAIDIVIKKTVVYTFITGIMAGFFFLLAGGIGGLLIKFAGVQSQWITIFSTLAMVAVFNPVRTRVQNFTDRRFFQKKYDYPQALRSITHQINSAATL